MPLQLEMNDLPTLYAPATDRQPPDGPAGPALYRLVEAWQALALLEENLSDGPDRWQADGIQVAREGIRRAWLAVSNLDRGLRHRPERQRLPCRREVLP